MSLKNCKACGGEISHQAEKCPHCGHPQTKRSTMGFATIIAAIVVVILLVNLQDDRAAPKTTSPITANPASPRVTTPAAPKVVDSGAHWIYRQSIDEMASKRVLQASTRSTNTVNFKFPYSQPQRATLMIRDHPRHGKDVIFMIERGQILCTSYEECSVTVRFGDNPAITLNALGPSDNSRETIFFRGYQTFITNMLSVDTVRISPKVYQEGNPVFTFNVSHFNQSKFRPPE